MRKILLTILILTFSIYLKAQDVQLIVSKLSIENSIKTLLDARAISFSSYTPGYGVDMFNVKLIYNNSHPLVVTLIPPNRFRIQCGIIGRANLNIDFLSFDINGEGDITIEGVMTVEGSQGQLKLLGSADAVIYFSGVPGFVLNIINANQFTVSLPVFELASFVFTLPSIPLNYFTTNYPTINITNDNVILGLQTPSNFLIVDQKDQSGNRILNSSIAHWENNTFTNYTVPAIFSNLPVNSWQTFRGDQGFQLNPFQKYNNWNNHSEVENHKKFYLDGSLSRLNSNFKLTYSGIKIQNSFDEVNLNSGYLAFKDPWLIDYPDPLYGNTPRNRGMDAPFKQRPSPFYPDYTTNYNGDVYKGVFLNQSGPTNNWQPPYYSVKTDYQQNIFLNQTGRTHKFYFQGWSASPQGSAEFQNANLTETPVVFKQPNATVQANLKGTQLSNNSSAYSKGSQRKFIKINNGYLYSVYESMGNIYLERSTDNGASWHIFNQTVGKKLNSLPAHSPSMDFYNVSSYYGDVILVTFVEEMDAELARIVVVGISDKLGLPLLFSEEVSLVAKTVYGYGNPVIACSDNGKFLIAFKGWDTTDDGIYYRRGYISNWQLNWIEQNPFELPKVPNTNNLSINPTIAEDRSTSGISYQLAWEQSNQIMYCKLNEDANGVITQTNYSVVSAGSSFMFHSSPSIIAIGSGARICWLGYNDEVPPNASVVFKDPAYSRFWSFGSNASRPNINKSNDNTYYALAWSQNNSTIKFADNNLRNINEIIDIPGRDVQISNGNGKTNMFANIFKATSQPYFFTMSNSLNYYYSPQKSNGLLVSNGRSGVLRKNNSEIYFALGDIKVNDQKVAFVECPVELEIDNVSLLNQFLETEAFELNDNSSFEYTVQYGVVDTSTINGMFQQGEQIRFKVELVDNNTGELLGVYDDVVYDQNNHTDFENILYQVNTQGIGQRTVKLRLRIEENLNPEATMLDRLDTESVIGKSKRKEIKFQGEILPEEYALEQNYPNPFNPTTKIRYSIPASSLNPFSKGKGTLVTLKVYDVLGNEVATLVNEPKEPGYYEVEFSIGSFGNASGLASGVYIYRLTAGNFVASRKMMLIK